jgi:CheY-like chemotaxis protein
MKKILIIEDDPILTNIYRHKYEAAGYEVASAEDGEKGLQWVSDFRPDLIHLDLMLPKMNGVEVIRKIRSQPEFKSLPILVFSNSYAADLIGGAKKAGASRCLSKSNCSPRLLLDIIEELLTPPKISSTEAVRTIAAAPSSRTPSAQPPPSSPGPNEVPPLRGHDGNRFQPAVREEFLKSAVQMLANLRSHLQWLIKSRDEKSQPSHLQELSRTIHSLAGYAGMTGFVRISHISNILEVLVNELHNRPSQITSSILRTLAAAIDCLGSLLEQAPSPQDSIPRTPLILAVDDEPISRIAVRTALDKAHLSAIILDDPGLALKVLAQNRFDLIFLDVDMPGMDGFELSSKIRASVTNKTTPVVFVTALSDFDNRTRSTLSGGTDLIVKPFLQAELAVKTLTLISKSVVAARNGTSAPASRGEETAPDRHVRQIHEGVVVHPQ